MVYETETPLAPRSGLGPYREADYLGLPDEPRCELLYGRLLVTPAPTARHQHVVVKSFASWPIAPIATGTRSWFPRSTSSSRTTPWYSPM